MEGWGVQDAPNDGNASEGEIDTRELIAKQNRKHKKSGGFQSMGLSSHVFQGILKKGYKVPTPIQRKTIPIILEGKDVVAMARTGSGKTACFLIPLFERLRIHSTGGARAIILSPTRELALQTLKFTKELGRFTGLRAAVILGGDSIEGQFAAIHDNPDILIVTPGRFVHICVEMDLKLSNVEYIVFDEADRLFEMGFNEQLMEITGRLPETRQNLLFSATLPKMLIEFARAGLSDPVLIRLDVESKLSENLRMAFFKCNPEDKFCALLYLLRNVISTEEQTVIFVATKHHVEYVHLLLDLVDIDNTYSYSSLDPTARKINVAKFQTKKVKCLVVTDVAARGIDIPLLDNVVNFNFPAKPKLFIHRVGRVARAGRSGTAFSFVSPEEAPYLLDLHLFLSESIRFASLCTEDKDKDNWDKIYGTVPQSILDSEADQIQSLHKSSSDLSSLKKVIGNAYKQYVKSRPLASSESILRMKEESWDRSIGPHPLLLLSIFNNNSSSNNGNSLQLENERLDMLNSLKRLRPKTTVFETSNSTKLKVTQQNMQDKRGHDEAYIDNFHKRHQDRMAAKQEKDLKNEANNISNNSQEKMTDDDIDAVFSQVIGKKRKSLDGVDKSTPIDKKLKNINPANSQTEFKNNKKNKLGGNKKVDKYYKQDEFFIPYASKDRYTEEGYSIGTSFEKEACHANIDITQDEDSLLRKSSSGLQWDRKKKKFVGAKEKQGKRIKTESGVWISASYKSGRYQKWMDKCKRDGDNESDGENEGASKYRGNRIRSYNKKHPLLNGEKTTTGKKNKAPNRELKTDDEIRKGRKIAYQTKVRNEKDSKKKGNFKSRSNFKNRESFSSKGKFKSKRS